MKLCDATSMIRALHKKWWRLTYWQWAKIGIVALLMVNAWWVWRWERSVTAMERLRQTTPVLVEIKPILLPAVRGRLPSWVPNSWCDGVVAAGIVEMKMDTVELLRELGHCPHLRDLTLGGDCSWQAREARRTHGWKTCIREACDLSQLERLEIRFVPLAPDDLRQLARLPNLKLLRLHCTGLTDESVALLGMIPRLEILELTESLSDAAIPHLIRLRHVKEVYLCGLDTVTKAGQATFNKSRPDAAIYKARYPVFNFHNFVNDQRPPPFD